MTAARVPSARRWVGLVILALAVGGTATETALHRRAIVQVFVVPFSRDANLAEGAEAAEAQAASFLKAYPSYRVRVTGYAEPGGDPQASVALSERRAQAVRAALEADGVDPARVAALGGGTGNPPPRQADESDATYARRFARAEVTVERD